MKKLTVPHRQEQEEVNTYFQWQSSYWKDIYVNSDVQGEIIRERQAAVLDWVDGLNLAPDARVLEIGCGAGFLAIALAQHGFHIHAIDSTEAMVALASQHAAECGMSDLLSVDVGDVYSLAFEDASFNLVIAIGVIPWLERVEPAIQEMARVTKPGGHVILTADNRARLIGRLDPWLNPALKPLKQGVKDVLHQVGLRRRSLKDMGSTLHDRRFIDKALLCVDLVKIKSRTIGFGPFSFFRQTILPTSLGTRVHHRLQRLADRGTPGLRSSGSHYLVLAKKSLPQPTV